MYELVAIKGLDIGKGVFNVKHIRVQVGLSTEYSYVLLVFYEYESVGMKVYYEYVLPVWK